MDKKLKLQTKKILVEEKNKIERQLEKFATKDKKLKNDWDTKFPFSNREETGNAALEQAADEVEEYANLLPIEHSFELRLKSINTALKKLEKNEYGICEKCKKPIKEERLEAYPDAQYCLNCNSN